MLDELPHQPSSTLLAWPCFVSHCLPLVSLARSFEPAGKSLIQRACKLSPGPDYAAVPSAHPLFLVFKQSRWLLSSRFPGLKAQASLPPQDVDVGSGEVREERGALWVQRLPRALTLEKAMRILLPTRFLCSWSCWGWPTQTVRVTSWGPGV